MRKDDVRAVLFDFSGTLVDGYLDVGRCREAALSLINEQGYHISKQQYIAALQLTLEVVRHRRRLELETPFSTFIKDALGRLGVESTDALLRSIENADYTFYSWRLRPDVEEVIANLHRKVLLGIVSNSWAGSVLRVLADSRLLTYFKTVVLSKDVGYRKPNSRIYLRATDDLRVRADQTIFIGDSYIDDVVGPASVGMMQVWVGGSSRYRIRDIPLIVSGWTSELSTIRTAGAARVLLESERGKRRQGVLEDSEDTQTG